MDQSITIPDDIPALAAALGALEDATADQFLARYWRDIRSGIQARGGLDAVLAEIAARKAQQVANDSTTTTEDA